MPRTRVPCSIVPPYLLRHLALSRPDGAQEWARALRLDEALRQRRAAGPRTTIRAAAPGAPDWLVHTCENTTGLPGRLVRSAGQAAIGDPAADEAAAGVAATLSMYAEVYGRDSFDGAGATVSSSVHYDKAYANAFWDGTQLVFGDGDGTVFGRMTQAVDVLGHELAHAVTERTAGLRYQGQSGALNESLSDVFGSCVKQRVLGQDAGQADWLIGAGLFLPGIAARGLRDLAAPGTAYDDPALGKDPQPAHVDDYVETTDDNGGVHLNSGIPNRAFQLAAVAIGGSSAQGAGRVWFAALTGGLDPGADFATFAAATVAAAGEHADVVTAAWSTVGITPGVPAGPGPVPAGAACGVRTVTVRRSGGFAGRTTAASVDLASRDERSPEITSLLDRIDLRAVAGGLPRPDMFVYDFDLCGETRRVPEQHLTSDLRRVADLVLRSGVDDTAVQ